VGGMMNAYKQAALDALNHAEIVECTIDDVFEVSFGYPEMNTVMRFIKDLGVDINKQIMALNCKIQFNIRRNHAYKAIEKFSGLKNIEIKKLEK
jgi:putative IMPACT (imprinted ancient) family translation regulator